MSGQTDLRGRLIHNKNPLRHAICDMAAGQMCIRDRCRISEQIYQIQYSGIAKGDIRILRSSLMQMYENFSEREDAKEGRRA